MRGGRGWTIRPPVGPEIANPDHGAGFDDTSCRNTPGTRRGAEGLSTRLRRRRGLFRVRQHPDADLLALHAAGLRPGLSSRSVPTLIALTVLVARSSRSWACSTSVRGRVAARVGAALPDRLDSRVFDAVRRLASTPASGRSPSSALRPRGGAEARLVAGALRHLRHALGAVLHLPDLLPIHPWLDRRSPAGSLILCDHRCSTSGRRAAGPRRRGDAALRDAFAETIRRRARWSWRIGMRGALLDRWQKSARPLPRRAIMSSDRVSQLFHHHQDLPLLPAVGDARPRRLRGAEGRDERRRDDRGLDPARPAPCADRARDRRLAVVHLRPPGLEQPPRPCSATPEQAGADRPAPARAPRRRQRQWCRPSSRRRASQCSTSGSKPARRSASSADGLGQVVARPHPGRHLAAGAGRPPRRRGARPVDRTCGAATSATCRRTSCCSTAPSPRTSPA